MKGWASTRANYKGIFFENSTFVKFVFCCCCYNSVYLRSPENICKGWEKMCHWPYPTESNCGLSVSAVLTLSLPQPNRIASLPLFVYFLVKKRELLLPLSLHSSFHTVTDVGSPVVDTIVMYVVLVLSTLRNIFTFPRHAFGKIICMLKHQL